MESRVQITCPECSEFLHPTDIYSLMVQHPDLIEKYENFSLRRVLMTDPDTRWCPAPDCTLVTYFIDVYIVLHNIKLHFVIFLAFYSKFSMHNYISVQNKQH